MRRQHANVAMWRAILADFELPSNPRYLAAAPISHVAGTKVAPVLLRGGTPDGLGAEGAARLFGSGGSEPRRWQDIWSAGHTVSAVDGEPSVADLVARTEREYHAARDRCCTR